MRKIDTNHKYKKKYLTDKQIFFIYRALKERIYIEVFFYQIYKI